jgi:hypothetical protein
MAQTIPPAGIPEAARASFERLLVGPVPSPHELLHALEGHARVLELALTGQRSLSFVRQITDRCRAMLDRWGTLGPDARRAVAAAVRYFALRDDAVDDIGSELGLVDDAQVVNAVLAHLGFVLPPIEIPDSQVNDQRDAGPGTPTGRG